MTSLLAIYLRNHEAAARGGVDHFQRIARTQRARPWAEELTDLREEVGEDLAGLRQLMKELRIRPDPLAGTTMRLAEKIGRTKLNGRLLLTSPVGPGWPTGPCWPKVVWRIWWPCSTVAAGCGLARPMLPRRVQQMWESRFVELRWVRG